MIRVVYNRVPLVSVRIKENQGESLSMVHSGWSSRWSSLRRYRMRSWRRDGFPHQNSISLRDVVKAIKRLNNKEAYFGITLQPPQKSGVGTLPPWLSWTPKRSKSFARRESISPSSITVLCLLAHAPTRLPTGRLWKYSSLSLKVSFSTRPVTRTERCISRQ